MDWSEAASHLIAFVVGVASGVLGSFVSSSMTDRRRIRDRERDDSKRFSAVREQMPELLGDMRADLGSGDGRVLRDFYVLPSFGVSFNTGGKRTLTYAEDKYPDLRAKLSVLENHGYIRDVTHSNVPSFRMSEEFVRRLFSD